jgi:chitinase
MSSRGAWAIQGAHFAELRQWWWKWKREGPDGYLMAESAELRLAMTVKESGVVKTMGMFSA